VKHAALGAGTARRKGIQNVSGSSEVLRHARRTRPRSNVSPRPAPLLPNANAARASQLFEVDLLAHATRGFFDAFEYDVVADGSRLLVNRLASPSDTSMMIIVN
jgi:hypothetical protein